LKDASEILFDIETLRLKLVDEFDELAVHSGACSYKEPDFAKIYSSFFIMAEFETNGFINSIEKIQNPPLFKTSTKLSPKLQKVYERITVTAKCLLELEEKVRRNEIKGLKENLTKHQAEYEKLIKEKYVENAGLG
jgi:hypothetical protein